MLFRKIRVLLEDLIGERASLADELGVGDEIGEAEIGEAGLRGAEDIAGTAKSEIGLSDFEAVVGFF